MMLNAMDDFELAEKSIQARREKFPQYLADFERARREYSEEVEALNTDGFVGYPGFVPSNVISTLNEKFENWAKEGINLQLPRDILSQKPGQEDWEVGRIGAEDVAKGLPYFRHRTHMVQVQDPLIQFPELLSIGLNEHILDIVGAYLGCLPSLGFVKVTKSLANEIPAFDTQLYHIDGNSAKTVKAFVLFHDVDEETGPHALVKNSHKDRFDGCFSKIRWTEEEMAEKFGSERIVHHTGKAGDLIVEDTSAFHCGAKPSTKDRTIAILNYVAHSEYGGGGAKLKAPKSLLDGLTEKQIHAADEIEFV